MSQQQFFGTIRPQANFHAGETAENLKKAMKGFGCDKQKVVQELTRINNAQRQTVSQLSSFVVFFFISNIEEKFLFLIL